MNRIRRIALMSAACLVTGASAAEPISLVSLLDEMVDTEAIARWPAAEYTCKQASSYDRAEVAPDRPGWFANSDHSQYLRAEENEGRHEMVMMEADGPGALVRWWQTAGGGRAGTIRVYLDGGKSPAMTFSEFDLRHGELHVDAPLAHDHPTGSGSNLYLPIPYARHAKVTWEEKSSGARYYHIDYRTYAPGTVVQTLTLSQVAAAKEQIGRVNRLLAAPSQIAAGTVSAANAVLTPGATWGVDLPTGANAIRALELRLEADDQDEWERSLRSVVLKISFDGEPAVWCPATDFFGTAIGMNDLRSWYRTVGSDGTMRCRWVMPYETSARLTLLNLGSKPVRTALHVTTAPWRWDQRSMHFHATWHQGKDLKTPPVSDWNYVTIAGSGVYVGDSLAIYNPVATWYGEGDEKIRVDGEAFPSHMGTGTEDYYNYSYAPKPVHQTPFSGLVRQDQAMTQGWSVMSRTRLLDGIPFRTSLRFDLELMAWKPMAPTYAATTYWYAFPHATTTIAPQPTDAAAPIPTLAEAKAAAEAGIPRRKGALEGETLRVTACADGVETAVQDMEGFAAGVWSGGQQRLVRGHKVGDFIELEVPAPDATPRQIVVYLTQANDYGILGFRVDGQPRAVSFDAHAPNVQLAPAVKLGVFTPKDGRFLMRIDVTGADPQSAGAKYLFGLDCIVLEPAP